MTYFFREDEPVPNFREGSIVEIVVDREDVYLSKSFQEDLLEKKLLRIAPKGSVLLARMKYCVPEETNRPGVSDNRINPDWIHYSNAMQNVAIDSTRPPKGDQKVICADQGQHDREWWYFKINILQDLIIQAKGIEKPKLKPCKCNVPMLGEETFESVNIAYTKISAYVETSRGSFGGKSYENIFMPKKGKNKSDFILLDAVRDHIQRGNPAYFEDQLSEREVNKLLDSDFIAISR